jgi:hypothetical protein
VFDENLNIMVHLFGNEHVFNEYLKSGYFCLGMNICLGMYPDFIDNS